MESKIDATDRLRREGRWEEASFRRDLERKRLRAEGKSRRDANEESWNWMIERYDPLTDEQIDWHEATVYRAMANSPVDCAPVDHESEPDMSDVWWVYCNLLAWDTRLKKDDVDGARFLMYTMSSTAPTPAAERLVFLAAASPGRFLDQVVIKFKAAIQRLEQDDSVNKYSAPELQANIRHIQEIRGDLLARIEAHGFAMPVVGGNATTSA